MKNIDIRIMKLNKWYVPKSFALEDVENPVVLGFFDELKVKEVKTEDIDPEKLHPFTSGYRKLVAWKSEEKKNIEDFSSQEQILFLNMDEREQEDGTVFGKEAVKEFWSDKGRNCPYIFLSMIHICHKDKLVRALKKIKEAFKKDYLAYISFDYCDIVLFAHNIQIHDFLDNIKKLFVLDKHEEKIIFDTFSMVSFWPPSVREQSFLESSETGTAADTVEKFHATINISVRNYRQFKKWYESEIKGSASTLKLYNIYGRNDVSITNEEANYKWLMGIMEMLHNEKHQKMFWTFETFIKVLDDGKGNGSSEDLENINEIQQFDELEQNYNKVKQKLNSDIQKLEEAIKVLPEPLRGKYILPVYEVRDCICSIVKNGFAEEFVCCIYESFLHFTSYMEKKISKMGVKSAGTIKQGEEEDKVRENKIAKAYDEYFTAINILVNSTMHSDRQFVQTTTVSAAYCFVPPKIMAFYNAYVYRLKQILKGESEKEYNYTFLIYPSFSPSMAVKQISLNDRPPCDRILTVTANEGTLYDIEMVICQLVHELAHYIGGDGLRLRSIRCQKIIHTLVRWIADECEIDEMTYQRLLQYFDDAMENKTGAGAEFENYQYLRFIYDLGRKIIMDICCIDKADALFTTAFEDVKNEKESSYDEFLESCGIDKDYQADYLACYKKQYHDVKYKQLYERVNKMNDRSTNIGYREYIETIEFVYKECYADLQMILVIAMNAEDYLNSFHINIDQKITGKRIIRVSTIFRVMRDCGFWAEPTENDSERFQVIYGIINEYNRTVEKETDPERLRYAVEKADLIRGKKRNFSFKNGIQLKEATKNSKASVDGKVRGLKSVPMTDIAAGLYEYLLEVMEKSLEEYSKESKLQKIQEVRELIREIMDFKDVTSIFNCVESELELYKRIIYEGSF